jgi:hypothetical protein
VHLAVNAAREDCEAVDPEHLRGRGGRCGEHARAAVLDCVAAQQREDRGHRLAEHAATAFRAPR